MDLRKMYLDGLDVLGADAEIAVGPLKARVKGVSENRALWFAGGGGILGLGLLLWFSRR